ncbi:HAD family hydrolase [Actinopolymorpha pittospori]|uniref:Hydrolase of the HAD superfamily n=1 Tax=Actinopolymorpha pittospori TaxID=648752 RepID=A0A927N957_9ACTN|nr:HAD family hydrolase [Actinopolymorpha pittospori]MBE1611247.1 putative hydrolase of the HAD superfamily [Actinopolymorpha pittospori]
MTVDAVIFDWGGTLTPWHTVDLHDQWRSYARAYDPTHDDSVAAALLAAEDEAWRLARDKQLATTFETIVRAAGLEPSGPAHLRGVAAFRTWWEPHTRSDPEAGPLLVALRERGIRVGVLSNTIWPRDDHELVFRRDGLLDLIDGAVYTSEIAHTKPHPEAFLAAMRAVRVEQPRHCVFVGDRLFDDIHGARSAGMRAVHVPHSQIPAGQLGHTLGEPDAVVERLADLLPLVDRWRA